MRFLKFWRIRVKMSLKITENEITLVLKKGDLETILEELNDCRDLIDDCIRVDGDKVIYNYHQMKMLDPEKVFMKNIPEYTLDQESIFLMAGCFILTIVSIPAALYYFNISNAWAYVGLVLFAFVIFSSYAIISFLSGKHEHVERYRKATYLKAKLISFFYLSVFQFNTGIHGCLEKEKADTKRLLEEAHFQIDNLPISREEKDDLLNLLKGIRPVDDSDIPKHFS